MSVMALDLATRTGLAVGEPGSTPVGASADFSRYSGGARYAALSDWLADQIAVHRPIIVVAEAPVMAMEHAHRTALMLIGMLAVAELTAARAGISHEVVILPVSSVRLHFCGSGSAKKSDVMLECHRRGWRPRDDNAADAMAAWWVATNKEATVRSALKAAGR